MKKTIKNFKNQYSLLTSILTLLLLLSLISYLIWKLYNITLLDKLKFADFGVYYSAGKQFLNGGNVYNWSYLETEKYVTRLNVMDRFWYPPLTLLLFVPFSLLPELFVPFSLLPELFSAYLWVILEFLLFCYSIYFLLDSLEINLDWRRFTVLIILLLGFQPVWAWISLGQIIGFLSALICLIGGLIIRNNKNFLNSLKTSFLVSILVYIKPYYALIGSYSLKQKNKFIKLFSSFIFLIIISIALFGVEMHLNYLKGLFVRSGVRLVEENSLFNTLISPLSRIIFFSSILILLPIISNLMNKRISDKNLFTLSVFFVPLASPVHPQLVISALIAPIIVLLVEEIKRDGKINFVILAILFIQFQEFSEFILVPNLTNLLPDLEFLISILFSNIGFIGILIFSILTVYKISYSFLK